MPDKLSRQLIRAGYSKSPEWVRMACSSAACQPHLEALSAALTSLASAGQLSVTLRAAYDARVCLEWDAIMERLAGALPPPDWLARMPRFEGEVFTDGELLERASWDFGKVRRRQPGAVLRPANTRDVEAAVRFCRAEGIGLSPRGFAHSAGAQMQVRGGLVLDMKSMDRVCAVEKGYCEVEAGAGWDVVLRAAMKEGLTPPIVTDWLKVSVGGTISMGGFGFMSFWRGSQMDQLLELEVVTGEGRTVRCSAQEHADLFDAVKGTHGKFGIITKARIPLERAPEAVRLVQACYGDLKAMYGDLERHTLERSTDLIHAFAAQKSRASIVTKMNSTEMLNVPESSVQALLGSDTGRWVYNLELVDFIGGPHGGRHSQVDPETLACEPGLVDVWEMDWTAFCFRVPPLVLEEQFRGAAPHPELCAWVPMTEEGRALLASEFDRMDPEADVGNGPVLFFPLRTKKVAPTFFRLPQTEHCIFWGLLRRADPPTAERIAALLADNESVFQRVRAVGGERYLPDTPPESAAFWRTHFGEQWQDLIEARRRWDPSHIFTGSFGKFS